MTDAARWGYNYNLPKSLFGDTSAPLQVIGYFRVLVHLLTWFIFILKVRENSKFKPRNVDQKWRNHFFQRIIYQLNSCKIKKQWVDKLLLSQNFKNDHLQLKNHYDTLLLAFEQFGHHFWSTVRQYNSFKHLSERISLKEIFWEFFNHQMANYQYFFQHSSTDRCLHVPNIACSTCSNEFMF